MNILRYGIDSSVEIDSAEAAGPQRTPLADPGEALSAALVEPLDYPPLAQCTTPGDRVVLALDSGTPRIAEITAAVVHELLRAGVGADGICVLLPNENNDGQPADPCRLVDPDQRERIRVVTHASDDRKQLAYLAADSSAEAILVNRALHDADLVLPIGCMRDDRAAGYFGIHSVVYPTFSDTKTIQRFRGLGSLSHSGERCKELIEQVNNVAWLLGVVFTIQVVPGGGEQIMHVLAGNCESVGRRGQELNQSLWGRKVDHRTDLVVAAIEGPADVQTWENLGRVLHTADSFLDEGGAVAVCCDILSQPGPGVRHLTGASTRGEAMRHIRRHRPADALSAAQIAAALDRGKVYLLSRLESAVVEELDMVPLENAGELARLIQQHNSCTTLANAQYVIPVE